MLKLSIKDINNTFHQLDRVYRINDGGCCFVAGVVASWLENHKIPFSVVLYGDALQDCCCWTLERPFAVYHVAIKIGEDILNPINDGQIEKELKMTSDQLLGYYYKCAKDWNPAYKTENNPLIRMHIMDCFNFEYNYK